MWKYSLLSVVMVVTMIGCSGATADERVVRHDVGKGSGLKVDLTDPGRYKPMKKEIDAPLPVSEEGNSTETPRKKEERPPKAYEGSPGAQ
jgi:hypothetical protein